MGLATPTAQAAFADMQPDESLSTGLLPSQYIKAAIHNSREIEAVEPICDDQIQPASLDLRLGSHGYRVPASFLPGSNATVRDRVAQMAAASVRTTGVPTVASAP